MATTVPTAVRSLKEYRTSVGHQSVADIASLAKPLRGTRILHLSTTPSRAELSSTLSTLTSLLQDVGLKAEWRVIRTKPQQITANETLQRALSGHFVRWTPELAELWHDHSDDILGIPVKDYDFIVVHDAELAGIIGGASCLDRAKRVRWIWHCHSDVSKTQPDVWNFLMRHTLQYDRRIVSSLEQAPSGSHNSYYTIPPNVDPLNLRNRDLPSKFIDSMLKHYELDPSRPMILSVLGDAPDLHDISRIIDGFLLAKDQVPELQLLALVSGKPDDQQASRYSEFVEHKVGYGRDIHLAPVPDGIGNISINVFQRTAIAVIESSQDEELTPTVLEAMWKGRPVIVGDVTAARLGIEHGRNGCIARSAKEIGHQIIRLVESRVIGKTIGQAAREQVRGNFLITKLLDVYLTMMQEMANRESASQSRLVAAR